MAFVHLHTHSEYSLLDGANRIPDLLDRVVALGMDSLAITDHGNLYGAWTFYEGAKARKVRPIIGCEAYLAFGSRHAREKPADAPGPYSHLVLLARNRIGYANLVKLSSIGYLEGFYRRPRIDREVLEQHKEGSSASPPASPAKSPCTCGPGITRRPRRVPATSRGSSDRTGSGSR